VCLCCVTNATRGATEMMVLAAFLRNAFITFVIYAPFCYIDRKYHCHARQHSHCFSAFAMSRAHGPFDYSRVLFGRGTSSRGRRRLRVLLLVAAEHHPGKMPCRADECREVVRFRTTIRKSPGIVFPGSMYCMRSMCYRSLRWFRSTRIVLFHCMIEWIARFLPLRQHMFFLHWYYFC